ncbi:MAG: crotonase/enoyl-CoA hydratase family protein [Marinobacterium sp.]|nr:crotonase/enoyl-CoA hydratase family protein [Marinobacterium sp.]
MHDQTQHDQTQHHQTFTLTVSDHIAHLQLSRPEAHNAMNRDFWQELPAALRALDASAAARVLVISATGKHFSAGMDLDIFTNPPADMFGGEPGRRAEAMRRLVLQLQDCFNAMEQLRIPVLAAVQGACIGGAVDMICAADMRYCTEDARFEIKETALGMTADLGTLQRLPRLISDGLVRELSYTARPLLAHEAQQAGLVNQLFTDQDSMLTGVMKIAAQIAQRSPLAVTGSKQMLNYARDHSLADSLQMMATWQAGMFQPTDLVQSFSARMQKTEPQYEGLRPIHAPFQD